MSVCPNPDAREEAQGDPVLRSPIGPILDRPQSAIVLRSQSSISRNRTQLGDRPLQLDHPAVGSGYKEDRRSANVELVDQNYGHVIFAGLEDRRTANCP
jgi:hypothetical protein